MNPLRLLDDVFARANYHTRLSERLPNTHSAVLMYHSVGEPQRYGSVPTERLRRDIQFLSEQYRIVDLPEVLDPGPEKRVALTFDDGLRNFYESAVPVLRELDVPATVFVSTGLIDREDEPLTRSKWVRDEFPEGSVMTPRQIRRLAESERIHVGNHTHTHPRLAALEDESTLRREIVGAKEELESQFGLSVSRFCYPFGDHDGRCVEIVADSHELAVTTRPDLVSPDMDRYRIPRLPAHVPERYLRWQLTDLGWYSGRVVRSVSR